jgi:hypothetical protein
MAIAARAVSDLLVAALIALLDMAAEGGRAAGRNRLLLNRKATMKNRPA